MAEKIAGFGRVVLTGILNNRMTRARSMLEPLIVETHEKIHKKYDAYVKYIKKLRKTPESLHQFCGQFTFHGNEAHACRTAEKLWEDRAWYLKCIDKLDAYKWLASEQLVTEVYIDNELAYILQKFGV